MFEIPYWKKVTPEFSAFIEFKIKAFVIRPITPELQPLIFSEITVYLGNQFKDDCCENKALFIAL